jgi:hypothetical protein
VSYYLQIDLEEAQPLATSSGYGDLIRWVETLAPPDHPELRHLCAHGWTGDVAGLKAEVDAALSASPPQAADTRATVENLRALLEGKDSAEVASVTDGLSADDEPDDEPEDD